MTANKRPKSSKRTRQAPPRRGALRKDHLGYAAVWLAGLAMGAWLF